MEYGGTEACCDMIITTFVIWSEINRVVNVASLDRLVANSHTLYELILNELLRKILASNSINYLQISYLCIQRRNRTHTLILL
jgi:hypothetical protein